MARPNKPPTDATAPRPPKRGGTDVSDAEFREIAEASWADLPGADEAAPPRPAPRAAAPRKRVRAAAKPVQEPAPAVAPPPAPPSLIAIACALALAAAVSLGITRFAYALLLPPMRADLGWSYTLAGAMNTVNALGYLIGALATPWLMRSLGPARVLLWGAALASVFMGWSGFFIDAGPLLLQRLLAGVASAFVFVAGGLLAARLAAREPERGGLLLGLFYGGVGFGIVLSALLVPPLLDATRPSPHGWTWAWWMLALLCAAASAALWWPVRAMQRLAPLTPAPSAFAQAAPVDRAEAKRRGNAGAASDAETANDRTLPAAVFHWRDFTPALLGYGLFGVGYIGYMTFVIALLKDQGVSPGWVSGFYALLGVAVMASSRIWAGLLDRAEGGEALALLNALLGVAVLIPAVTHWQPLLLVSGALFGGVFLSVVASTTALVRRSLAPAAWGAGISAFTVVFAAGQIVGPTVVGWIADGDGGLERGLVFSAGALWLGALIAHRQPSRGLKADPD
ncbi:MAG: YbfB/YjiJ family MFS transporter [Burkholderiales bacterium]